MHGHLRNTAMLTWAALAAFLSWDVSAQSVALAGLLGPKALLVVNGGQPRSLAAGESYQGVKLINTQGDQAVVDIAGVHQVLRLGDAPVSVGSSPGKPIGGSRIVLSADARGHFVTQGQINGRTTPMMVDTGATMVSLSVSEAQRVGLNYADGQVLAMSTANGVIPAWRAKLATLRVGEVTLYDLDAIVTSGAMPLVLLGNNFLGRFQMTRNNDQMVLDKRY